MPRQQKTSNVLTARTKVKIRASPFVCKWQNNTITDGRLLCLLCSLPHVNRDCVLFPAPTALRRSLCVAGDSRRCSVVIAIVASLQSKQ